MRAMLRQIHFSKRILRFLIAALFLSGLYVQESKSGVVFACVHSEEECSVINAAQESVANTDVCCGDMLDMRSGEYGVHQEQRTVSKASFVLGKMPELGRWQIRKVSSISFLNRSEAACASLDCDSIIRYIHNQDGSKG